MKTKMLAAALMMMSVAAHAAPGRVQAEGRPNVTIGAPGQLVSVRPTLLAPIRVDALPVTVLSPLESRMGAAVAAPRLGPAQLFVQVFVDGGLAAQGHVAPGTSRSFESIVKPDGLMHEMQVRVYREVIDRPRILAKEETFSVWSPVQ